MGGGSVGTQEGIAAENPTGLVSEGNTPRPMGTSGLICRGSKVTLANVSDGISNTLMVGETRYAETYGGVEGYICFYSSGFYLGGGHYMATAAGTLNSPNSSPCDPANKSLNPVGCHTISATTFGGYHTGNVLFARGDGSVGSISYNVDLAMYQSLGSRNDGSGGTQ